MSDLEYQKTPTNNNINWPFDKVEFVAEIHEYDGYGPDIQLSCPDLPDSEYGKLIIPAFFSERSWRAPLCG